MVTLRHPRFPQVTQEVAPEDVSRWCASGWLDERKSVEIGSLYCLGAVKCDRRSNDEPCDECDSAPEPEVKILPAPKPGPKRRTKNPSLGDD